ncbi:MAG: threonine synthase [Bacteroidota bacterium]
MQLFSTNHISPDVDLEEAVFRGLPQDNGLYMPYNIPKLPDSFFTKIDDLSIQEIAFEICKTLFDGELTNEEIKLIVNRAITFEAPLVVTEPNNYILELFHGPSMAFKDFGARFMASLMGFYLEKSQKKIKILVATSGDTGGAVAQGFHNTPNIDVVILYPSGKVSDIQEMQLTTLGGNVTAIEIDGTFDDCQALVKSAFLDKDLSRKYKLASANSINISRLIPQSFYYFSAFAQLKKLGNKLPVVFSVPSGNFGNLSAGLIAYQMGLPVHQFIAATNVNDVVPRYLESGNYEPVKSKETISNAMDVGNPSNFIRMKLLAGDNWQSISKIIIGYSYTDNDTKSEMKSVYEKTHYIMCPHTAVAQLGADNYKKEVDKNVVTVVLSTAHYAKFLPVMEPTLGFSPPIPGRLSELLLKEKVSTKMAADFGDFKAWLLG